MTVVDERVSGAGAPGDADPGHPVEAPGNGASERARGVRGWRSLLAGAVAYLVLSIGLWWNVWSSHPSSTTTCGCGDSSLFTWFLEWPAYALAHGLNPLYSTYLFHPAGINLLSNTAEVGLGIVLAPVTWAFGPIATLNVALTLSPLLSALAMYVLLRRWVGWAPAAFVGGLLYGFSPFVLVELTDAHLMLGFVAVPPLLVLCLDELLIRQRWRPWVTGLAIGVLALVQLSVGTELLVITAVAVGSGVLLVVAWGVAHPDAWRPRVPYALRAAAAAVVSGVVLLAYPAWFALAGPAHLSGDIWGTHGSLAYAGVVLGRYVQDLPADQRLFALGHQFGGYQGRTPSALYLGWALVAVVAAGLVLWWRDVRLWLFAVVGVIGAYLSIGLSFHGWSLWRLFERLPLMENVIPSRFAEVVFLCASVLLGLVCDHVHRSVVAGRLAVGPRPDSAGVGPARAVLGAVAGLLVAAIALVPIVNAVSDSLPLTATTVRAPQWFRTVAPHLPPDQVLLVFPFSFRQSNMTWQAVDGMSFAMVGGGGPDSILSRAGEERAGQQYLAEISLTGAPQGPAPGEVDAVRGALDGWGVTGVVLPDPRHLPEYEQVFAVRDIVVLVTAATGQAPTYTAGAWVWSGVHHAGPASTLGPADLARCAAGPPDGTVASIQASAACALGQVPPA